MLAAKPLGLFTGHGVVVSAGVSGSYGDTIGVVGVIGGVTNISSPLLPGSLDCSLLWSCANWLILSRWVRIRSWATL